MASRRMPYDATTPLGKKIQQMIAYGVAFRQAANELNLEVLAYVGDVSLQTDTGISSANIGNFSALLNQASAELGVTALVQINVGAHANVRDLLDEMG